MYHTQEVEIVLASKYLQLYSRKNDMRILHSAAIEIS